jgi:hypothetical protein
MNHDKLVIFARSFQPHFQAALRPARWNSDPRPTHPGQTAGKGGCLEKCIKMQCQSDTSCNFVEPGDHTQDALPKFLVGLTRSKFCFPLKHSNEWFNDLFLNRMDEYQPAQVSAAVFLQGIRLVISPM